jgi:NDP-sugar pyrophosphorylase family protein
LFGEFELKQQSVIDLYLDLAKRNRIVSKPIQPDYWFDLGKPEQLLAAEDFLLTQNQ